MTSPIAEDTYNQYLNALLTGDSTLCKGIVQDLLGLNISFLDLYDHLYRRSLADVGDLWAKNMITVADEHIATAITESLISQLQPVSSGLEKTGQRVLISCITSNLHQIGAKIVAGHFEQLGWDTYYLGANMPITDLLDIIDRIQPDVICLSLALVEHFKTLTLTIREIQLRHPQTPIVVGGQAFKKADPADQQLNAFQNVHILRSINQLDHFISGFLSAK